MNLSTNQSTCQRDYGAMLCEIYSTGFIKVSPQKYVYIENKTPLLLNSTEREEQAQPDSGMNRCFELASLSLCS